MATKSSVKGVIKVQGVPDSACFNNFTELLQALGQFLIVDIPNQEFSNLVISEAQPGIADRDKVWWRLSSAGLFVGIFKYSDGVWVQVLPAPGEIHWIVGNSNNPPPGYSFTAVQPSMSVQDYTELIALAVPNGGPLPYRIYPTYFIGI